MDSIHVLHTNSFLSIEDQDQLTTPAALVYTADGIYSEDELYWFKYIPIKSQYNISAQIMKDDWDLFQLCERGLVKLDDMMLFFSVEGAKNFVHNMEDDYTELSKYGRFSRDGDNFVTYQPLHISDGETIFDLDIRLAKNIKNIYGKDMSLTVDDVLSSKEKRPLLRMINRRVELRNDVDMEDVTELLDKLVHRYTEKTDGGYIW